VSAQGGSKAIAAALGANLGVAVIKFVAFLVTGSSSMLAESVHSVADSGNQGLLILGRKRATRSSTVEHPFGYGRERYFYAFVVAVVLFTVGAVFSLYEGYHKLVEPHPVESPLWAFIVLIAALVMESFSLRTAIRETNPHRGGMGWFTFIRRAKSPELPVLLLEDSAALIGLLCALGGVSMSVLTGDGAWDGVGTLAIGVLLGVVAVTLAIEMKSLLIGESASDSVLHDIVTAIEDGPEIDRVIHIRTMHLGPEELLVGAKIAVNHDESATEVADGIDAAEKRLRAAVPRARVVYLEPDLYEAARAPGESAAEYPHH